MRQKKSEPVVVKGMSFGEMIAEVTQRQTTDEEYGARTGKCCSCKKRKALPDSTLCSKCRDESNDSLKELVGEEGFAVLTIEIEE